MRSPIPVSYLLTPAGVKCAYSKSLAAARFTGWLPARAGTVNALFAGFLLSSTAILTVVLGVFGAYAAINAVLAAVNPSKPSRPLPGLVPNQSHASGD